MTGHRVHHVGLGALWDYCGACRRTGHVEYCRCGSVRVRRTPRHRVTCHDCPLVIHSEQAGSRNIVRQKPQPWPGTRTRRPFGLKPIAAPASNGWTSSILRPLWSETAWHSRAGILGLPAGEEVNDTQ